MSRSMESPCSRTKSQVSTFLINSDDLGVVVDGVFAYSPKSAPNLRVLAPVADHHVLRKVLRSPAQGRHHPRLPEPGSPGGQVPSGRRSIRLRQSLHEWHFPGKTDKELQGLDLAAIFSKGFIWLRDLIINLLVLRFESNPQHLHHLYPSSEGSLFKSLDIKAKALLSASPDPKN